MKYRFSVPDKLYLALFYDSGSGFVLTITWKNFRALIQAMILELLSHKFRPKKKCDVLYLILH